jgi:hypothetical protein
MSEHDEQVALMVWAETGFVQDLYPGIELLFAIPNGGHRHKAVAARMQAEGVKPGVPDLFLPVPRGEYHGLFIELKHGKNTATDYQQAWIEQLEKQGYLAVVCHEAEGAQAMIEEYYELEAPDAQQDVA